MNIFTSENFEQEVLKSKIPVFVDFWAPWCGPCRMMSPLVDELSAEYSEKIKIGKCNVDENSALAEKYGIMSIPAFLIFKNGKPVDQVVGGVAKNKLQEMIENNL